MEGMLNRFDWARKVNTPIVHIATPDDRSTITAVRDKLGSQRRFPCFQWDCLEGLRAFPGDDFSQEVLLKEEVFGAQYHPLNTVEPQNMLAQLLRLPSESLVFLKNIHLFYNRAEVRQGIANLRDAFKRDKRQAVLLTPGMPVPVEIARDVFQLRESLPGDPELQGVVLDCYAAFRREAEKQTRTLADPELTVLERCVDAVRGLTHFGAEQACFTSMTREGIDLDALWSTKREQVAMTPGLRVYQGSESFETLGGLQGIKGFLKMTFEGRRRPRVIVHLDEIEKVVTDPNAPSGDNGVGKRVLERILTTMSDNRWGGVLFLGIPGGGKSTVCKAAGNSYQVPTVRMDIGAAMGSLVGETEHNVTHMMEILKAMGGEHVLMLATCNSLGSMPPELLRRFPTTFFVDFPSPENRAGIWDIYLRQRELDVTLPRPADGRWTGADIENCATKAYEFGCSLTEAARFVQPVYRQAGAAVESLRVLAQERAFLDAETGEDYRITDTREALTGGRNLDLPE